MPKCRGKPSERLAEAHGEGKRLLAENGGKLSARLAERDVSKKAGKSCQETCGMYGLQQRNKQQLASIFIVTNVQNPASRRLHGTVP
jgi:hypothetical protein